MFHLAYSMMHGSTKLKFDILLSPLFVHSSVKLDVLSSPSSRMSIGRSVGPIAGYSMAVPAVRTGLSSLTHIHACITLLVTVLIDSVYICAELETTRDQSELCHAHGRCCMINGGNWQTFFQFIAQWPAPNAVADTRPMICRAWIMPRLQLVVKTCRVHICGKNFLCWNLWLATPVWFC